MEHANISLEERRSTLKPVKVANWLHLTQNQSLFAQTWILGFSSNLTRYRYRCKCFKFPYRLCGRLAVRGKFKFCFVSIGREEN
jgi:hypothetical protein